MKPNSLDWTMVAMTFMGDGTKSVAQLMDVASNQAFAAVKEARQKLKSTGQPASVKNLIEIAARLEQITTDFCRPFGQFRYITGVVPEVTLDTFKAELNALGGIFKDLEQYAREWTRIADVGDTGLSPAAFEAWKKKLTAIEDNLSTQRQGLKKKLNVEENVQKTYIAWDECLAKLAHAREPLWMKLKLLGLDAKKDSFADLDRFRDGIQAWKAEIRKSPNASGAKDFIAASQVLEQYVKWKHLQKAMSVW